MSATHCGNMHSIRANCSPSRRSGSCGGSCPSTPAGIRHVEQVVDKGVLAEIKPQLRCSAVTALQGVRCPSSRGCKQRGELLARHPAPTCLLVADYTNTKQQIRMPMANPNTEWACLPPCTVD
eukprot:1156363-Pelagomonas_calceolata.AAC.2